MWGLLAGIFGSILGFGSSYLGLNRLFPNKPATTSIPDYYYSACYDPQTNVSITLSWPDDFTNLTDNRKRLNPGVFGSLPASFNTDDNCQDPMLADTNNSPQSERTYILVRENLRISSCKTDEMAGPYNGENGKLCSDLPNWWGEPLGHRGNCSTGAYTDLRKVAEKFIDGETVEIFWVPFSYHVGCNYETGNNCGPGARTHLNLRDFIYVLRNRDAFDPLVPSECKVKWDAGSTDKGACSHYFDIYMAADLYNKTQDEDLSPADPDYDTYRFVKDIVENCQEQNTFVPVVEPPGLSFPPKYIPKPFVLSANPPPDPATGMINPGNNPDLIGNYEYFVLSGKAFDPAVNSLYLFTKSNSPLTNVCTETARQMTSQAIIPPTVTLTPTPTFGPTCYFQLGTVPLTSEGKSNIFNVYTRGDTPQTIYLTDSTGTDRAVYHYTITDQELPFNDKSARSLQLTELEFTTENEWTWATPYCKPAIYFYPEKPTDLNVRLDVEGKLTVSDPQYDPVKGWNIKAYPDGKLSDNSQHLTFNNKYYPYLYYEADVKGVEIPREGWVVGRSDTGYRISDIMQNIGFNEKEINDFLAYWLPRLTDRPYYFITLTPEETINQKEKLTFSQTPDTLIRTRFVFEGLDRPLSVSPPSYKTHRRSGFTVTDWGGTLVGKNCGDVAIR